MADIKLSNEVVLEQLKHGTAKFELVSSPVPSISTLDSQTCPTATFLGDNSHRFFARIVSQSSWSPAMKKIEFESGYDYEVKKVTGDGRALFRALVKGMDSKKSFLFHPFQPTETKKAEKLRMDVKKVICESDQHHQYEEALFAININESLKGYCQRIEQPDFWGGESELLVLSKLYSQPIIVYIPAHEVLQHTKDGRSGFIPIAEYGFEGSTKENARKVVRLLYSGGNHYDLLVSKK